jgi:hypothetical protein
VHFTLKAQINSSQPRFRGSIVTKAQWVLTGQRGVELVVTDLDHVLAFPLASCVTFLIFHLLI